MDHEHDDLRFDDLYDEEARRYGWRRVAASDRPGASRMDLCGHCAAEAGLGPPLARWGY